MNGCPVRVATFAAMPSIGTPINANRPDEDVINATLTEGFEIELMKTLARKMNFKPIYRWIAFLCNNLKIETMNYHYFYWLVSSYAGGITATRLFSGNIAVSGDPKEIAKTGEIMIGNLVNAPALSQVYDYSTSFWTVIWQMTKNTHQMIFRVAFAFIIWKESYRK